MGLLLIVGAMAVVAGCPQASTIDLYPQAGDADRLASGAYRLQFTADVYERGTDVTLSDVRIDGYTISGERVCQAEFGDLSESQTVMQTCDEFPAILLADTSNRGERVPADSAIGRDSYSIETHVSLYLGRLNGEHRFETVTAVSDGLRRAQLTNRSGTISPTQTALQTWQCRQWKRHDEGADLSSLATAPWRDWERQAPNTTRVYELTVWNYTRLREVNRTDRAIETEPVPYSIDQMPPAVQRAISTQVSRVERFDLTRGAFYDTVHQLSTQPANSSTALPAAFDQIRGSSGSYDNVDINCQASLPKYRENQGGLNYDRGQWVRFLVEDGDLTWALDLRTRQVVSGPAFLNQTVSGD